jgi:Flp pilus assembly CpaE family ATPase
MSADRPLVLLGLTPLAERAVEPLLFGEDAPVELVGSASEADELDRLSREREAAAALISAQLPGLTSGHCARVRSAGLRVVGLALDPHERDVLDALGADITIDADTTAEQLASAVRDAEQADHAARGHTEGGRRDEADESRAVVAVIGSKGAPGASELAASLAALASDRWPVLLVELDALGGDLDVRTGADPDEGSVLGLVRAAQTGRPDELRSLLERWVVGTGEWSAVLLGAPMENGALAELSKPGAVALGLNAAARLWPAVVCDLGFALADESDSAAARVHREAIVNAGAVIVVIGARDAQLRHGLVQLDTLLDDLVVSSERVRVVVNGLGAPGTPDRRSVQQTIVTALTERRLTADALLPWDARGLRRAQRLGVPLARAHPRGGYARALRRLLDALFLPSPEPLPRERKRSLRSPTLPPADTAEEG